MSSENPGFSRYDLALLVVSVIWGANFSANKYALGVLPPLVFSGSRFVLASLLLYLTVAIFKPGDPIPARSLAGLVALGVVGNTLYQVVFMYGLKTTSAINGALILAALPVFVAVLGIVFRVERPTPPLWLGMFIAMVGVAIVITGRGAHFSAATLQGDLLVLAACFCWAAFTVGVRFFGRGLNHLRVTAITTYAGTPGLVLLAWPDLVATKWTALAPATWVALLYSAIFSIVVAYGLWAFAVQGVGSNRTAIYNCVIPVFAALVAWIVLGERPGLGQAAGAALVFAGVIVSQRQPSLPVPAPAVRAIVPEP